MWQGDGVQIAIDSGSLVGQGGNVNTFYELGVSLKPDGAVSTFAWSGNFDWSKTRLEGRKELDGYTLKIGIPWSNIGLARPSQSIGVNVVINHNQDGQRRFVEWRPGTVRTKNREVFARAAVASGQSPATEVLATERARYDAKEEIKGKLVEYSKTAMPPGKVRFSIRSGDQAPLWTSEWVDLKAMAPDSTRITSFTLPAKEIGQEGDYELTAEHAGGKALTKANFRREDLAAQIATGLKTVQEHLRQTRARWGEKPALEHDSYIRMALVVADYYLERIEKRMPPSADEPWRLLQIQEIGQMLAWIDGRLAGQEKAQAVPPPSLSPVKSENGLFMTTSETDENKPLYLYGYGHFAMAAKDLPVFASIGASLIQQGNGPATMNEDGTFSDAALSILQTLPAAAAQGIRVDYLLSPHDFPTAAYDKYPDLRLEKAGGFIKFNIDHPAARKILSDWIKTIVPEVAKSPALLSLCLSNEPVYSESGRDEYSRPDWTRYLSERHGTIAALNALYGTAYQSFNAVPVPTGEQGQATGERRAFYDWIRFNQQHFAEWHRWMNALVKQAAPDIPTHAKIMTDIFDRENLSKGIDPELICDITDLAGNDSYAWPKDYQHYAYNWRQEEMWYDLLHSFRGQPVFNSENHLILDGSPAISLAPAHTRCVLWQGALHHLAASTTWVWEAPVVPDLEGSIYLRPANVCAAGETMLDLTRLSPEIAKLSGAKAEVALLYSIPSLYWDADYPAMLASAYAALTFLGHPVTFISETQLMEGRRSIANAQAKLIVLSGARHVPDKVCTALSQFLKDGGYLLSIGPDNLLYDEYDRKRNLARELTSTPVAWKQGQDENLAQEINAQAGGSLTRVPTLREGRKTAWGIEYRVVKEGPGYLVTLTNLLKEPKQLSLDLPGTSEDLISGAKVDLQNINLAPMGMLLLRVAPREQTISAAKP